MVGTEYGMAWEMTHGRSAALVVCPVLPTKVSEGEKRAYTLWSPVASKTNKEAHIRAVDRGGSIE